MTNPKYKDEPDDLVGPLRREQVVNTNQFDELWNALPHCRHHIISMSGGGVKCAKCHGWCCY